jgi:hypothetical protein
MFHIIL